MKRSHRALAGLVLLTLLAGCSMGAQEVPTEELTGNATYDWNRSTDVYYNVTSDRYEAIHGVSNQSHLEVYSHDALGSEVPLDITALQFRFSNGTVVTADHANLSATKGSGRTNISLPAREGDVAYTGFRNGKEFGAPVFVEGSYAVTLPGSARVGIPLLSSVSPGGFGTALDDGRVTVTWDSLEGGSIHLRWYLELDLLLFSVIAIVGGGLAIGGTVYYLRQIRKLRRRRESVGIDVDQDEDDPRDRGPPPGMG